MKRRSLRFCAYLLCICTLLGAVGCTAEDASEVPHVCSFTEQATDTQYLKTAANCQSPAEYYYSCSCGEKGETTFFGTELGSCDFSVKEPKNTLLKSIATCTDPTEYYCTCVYCGKKGDVSFAHGECADHRYAFKEVDDRYLKSEATTSSPALYYLSCICGAAGTETFEHGKRLLTEEEKMLLLAPKSLTVTLYDAQNSVYGFTFNTREQLSNPVIQIKKATASAYSEYAASSLRYTSYDLDNTSFEYYVSKAEIALEPNTSYLYRIYDKDSKIATEEFSLKTKDPTADSFTFVHVSDSQDGPAAFGRVLSAVSDEADFIIHTGDVVQYSKYEQLWETMLDENSEYLTGIPVMAISGNHETTYTNSGSKETYKHFNHQIPTQQSTSRGYFYSFIYGDIKFIMLNTNDLTGNKLKDEQYDWLVNELQNNTCKWTVVSMHNPLYSVGKYGSTENTNAIALALQEQLQGIFAEYGVDVVLQGHDHAVSRTKPINGSGYAQQESKQTVSGIEYIVDPGGVIYVMNGPAGTQSRSPVSTYDQTLYAYAEKGKEASFAEFTFDGDTLTVTVKYMDGEQERVYYTRGIIKTNT